METTALIVIVYGFIVLAGGVMGYVKARSAPSLMAGLAFGIALIVSGFCVWHGMRNGLKVAMGLAVALLVVMGIRFVKSKKFMPAGLVALLSAIVTVVLAVALR